MILSFHVYCLDFSILGRWYWGSWFESHLKLFKFFPNFFYKGILWMIEFFTFTTEFRIENYRFLKFLALPKILCEVRLLSTVFYSHEIFNSFSSIPQSTFPPGIERERQMTFRNKKSKVFYHFKRDPPPHQKFPLTQKLLHGIPSLWTRSSYLYSNVQLLWCENFIVILYL